MPSWGRNFEKLLLSARLGFDWHPLWNFQGNRSRGLGCALSWRILGWKTGWKLREDGHTLFFRFCVRYYELFFRERLKISSPVCPTRVSPQKCKKKNVAASRKSMFFNVMFNAKNFSLPDSQIIFTTKHLKTKLVRTWVF